MRIDRLCAARSAVAMGCTLGTLPIRKCVELSGTRWMVRSGRQFGNLGNASRCEGKTVPKASGLARPERTAGAKEERKKITTAKLQLVLV